MKYFIALLILALPLSVSAATVNFSWDANTETDLAGYRLYQSTMSNGYDLTAPVADIEETETTFTVSGLSDGTYFWVLTAYDNVGNESEPSNEVTITIDETAPDAPSGFKAWIQEVISWIRGWFSNFRSEIG